MPHEHKRCLSILRLYLDEAMLSAVRMGESREDYLQQCALFAGRGESRTKTESIFPPDLT